MQSFEVTYHHIMGHLDKLLHSDQLTEIRRLNALCDSMAKKALLRAICKQEFINWDFLFEDISLVCGGHKVTSSPMQGIHQ